jgi:hypothetical protein
MKTTIDMAREVYGAHTEWTGAPLDRLEQLVAIVRADERMSFYGQDKPAECADGCPPNQICDYCQVVAPAKAMILAEREACAKVCDDYDVKYDVCGSDTAEGIALQIRARGNT